MSRISPMSQFHCFWFPRRMREIFDRWVTFETATAAEIAAWKETYAWMLRRVSIDEGHKPLCLKCPPHAARIRILRELFPAAKFVHIYRNPYVVYHSNRKMWREMIAAGALQRIGADELDRNLVHFYRALLGRFYECVGEIPSGHLVEVAFEDLERDPAAEVRRIYEVLNLGEAHPVVSGIVERAERPYRKNDFQFDDASLERVEREWGFALTRWGYSRPGTAAELRRMRKDFANV